MDIRPEHKVVDSCGQLEIRGGKAHPCTDPTQIEDTVAGARGGEGEAGEGERGEGEEEGDGAAHQQPLHHGGGSRGSRGERGEDEEDESGRGEKRSSLEKQLVQGAGALGVDKTEGGTQRELEKQEGIVEQVDEEEADDEEVGGGPLPAEDDGQDEDGVEGDTGQDEEGEEDHPDQAGGGTVTGGILGGGGGGADGQVDELEQLVGGGGHGHGVLKDAAFDRGDHGVKIGKKTVTPCILGYPRRSGLRFKRFAQGGVQRQTGCRVAPHNCREVHRGRTGLLHAAQQHTRGCGSGF